jgi:WD40 repeat protein
MFRKTLVALTLCASCVPALAAAQTCTPPAIVANAKTENLFTPDQEMILGELTVQRMAGEFRYVNDERLLAYVREIAAKLEKHLPPTGLKFQYHIIDIPDVNAFNIPGGHVFVSRKLISFSLNEDELAGVMAHDGVAQLVRHAATDISVSMRKILGVTSLGDRKDVTEKYNLLIERARTKRVSRPRGHEDDQQLEADKIGVYAMIAAGYDPSAFISAFARLTESKEKSGNWFSDIFGKMTPEQKRLREMANATEKLPASCREGRTARATEDFLKWQAEVVSFRDAARREELPGLIWRKELAPKLRSDISHFSFSADGKLLLAQDDYAITVIRREPPEVLFQIPVEDADDAGFTPDGQFVVFATENLRYEKWSVADRKPVEMRELVVRGDCWEHKLSPDGNYLACVDLTTTVNLIETKTGKKVWEKKEFYRLSFFEYITWLERTRGRDDGETSFFRIEFSPDSRYVVFSRSDKYRFTFKWDYEIVDQSENTALALDLQTMKTTDVGGDLKKLASHAYAFIDAGRVIGLPSRKSEDAGVFAFPSGKRLQKFTFGGRVVKRTASPDYVIVKPLANSKMGVFDLKRGALASAFDKEDGTLWNNLMAYESVNGKILLREVTYNEKEKNFDFKDVGTVEIPLSSLKKLQAAEVSDNFDWLLLSSKSRGGLWSLSTGERKVYVRGFRGGVVGEDGGAVGDFPTLMDVRHSLVFMNPKDESVVSFRELPEKGARQYGRFVLARRGLKETAPRDEKKDEKKGEAATPRSGDPDDFSLRSEVRFELKDFVQDKVIWTRDFMKEAPAFTFDEFSGRLIFYWRLGSDAGKAKLKESAELQAKADALGNKADDYLVEVIDAYAQKTIGAVLLETGNGSFDVGRGGISEGNWLVLNDSEGRVLVYSIKEGELRHRFFGHHAAVNPKRNQILVENFPGELNLYDLDTGDPRAALRINGSAAFTRFNLQGTKLLILNDTQTAYAFDLDKLAPKAN